MTGPSRPRGPQRRTGDRRQGDERRADETPPGRALVPADPAVDAEPTPSTPKAAPSGPAPGYAAQVLGQDGGRKGLRGGPPVLDAARGTYLGVEYSGAGDRRPRPGGKTRTDV